MTTTALLCIARNETPFTEEWLEYHFGIGIDRVYYVSTDSDFAPVRAFFDRSRYRSRVELFHFDSFRPGWQIQCNNLHLPLIEEDWVLVIDIDEFLYLHSWPNVGEFLETVPHDIGQIQFPWLNLMSTEYCHDRTFDILSETKKHVSDHVKSLVRRRYATDLGIHSHGIRESKSCLSSGIETPSKARHSSLLSDTRYCSEHPFVLHFCTRGHFDALNRILDQRFFNEKCGPNEERRVRDYLQNEPSWSNIPVRFMLMEFWSSLPTADVQCAMPRLGSRTDVRALKTVFLNSISKIIDFDGADLRNLEIRFEHLYRLDHKMRSHDSSATYDVDDYLKCSAQLEYIGKLRKSLEERRFMSAPVKPVFIHVSKNAGNSILTSARSRIKFAGHRTAASWVAEHGRTAPLFAVIRNPFDRVVSEYSYRKRRHDNGDRNAHLANLDKSFEDWIISTFREGEFRTRAFFEKTGISFNERNMIGDCLLWFLPQLLWLSDEQGRPLVLDLLRFEDLESDWAAFARRYGIPVELQRRNASPREPGYRNYYSDETRDLIADYYREDFEAFGYSF